jgi:hypothetical protein
MKSAGSLNGTVANVQRNSATIVLIFLHANCSMSAVLNAILMPIAEVAKSTNALMTVGNMSRPHAVI